MLWWIRKDSLVRTFKLRPKEEEKVSHAKIVGKGF